MERGTVENDSAGRKDARPRSVDQSMNATTQARKTATTDEPNGELETTHDAGGPGRPERQSPNKVWVLRCHSEHSPIGREEYDSYADAKAVYDDYLGAADQKEAHISYETPVAADGGTVTADADPTAGERMEAGEQPLPDDVAECRFCGAGRESLHYTRQTRNVDRHSHRGRVAYVLSCEECDGAYIVEQIEQTRVNVPSRPLFVAEWWSIPEGWVMSVCEGCGEPAGTHRDDSDNYPMFRAMRDGDLNTDCCGADGALKVGEFVVEGSR